MKALFEIFGWLLFSLACLSPFSIIIWIVNYFIAYSKETFAKSFAFGFAFFFIISILFILWIDTQHFNGFDGLGYVIGGMILLGNGILLYSTVFLFYFIRNRDIKEELSPVKPLNTDILDADVNFSSLGKDDPKVKTTYYQRKKWDSWW